MTSAVTHPLVSAYLRDLELLLHGVEPGERAEVLAGVHEHLDASLVPGASDEDVRRSLAELGSPQSVADEAYAGRLAPASSAPSVGHPRPGLLSRSWLPIVVGLGLGFALLVVTLVAAASTSYGVVSGSSGDSQGNVVQDPETVEYGGAFPQGALFALLMTTLLWFAPLLLTHLSPLWTWRQKLTITLILPVAAVAVTALPDLGWALTKQEIGINVGGWSGLAVALLGGGYLLVRMCRSAIQRAETLESGAL